MCSGFSKASTVSWTSFQREIECTQKWHNSTGLLDLFIFHFSIEIVFSCSLFFLKVYNGTKYEIPKSAKPNITKKLYNGVMKGK